MAIKLQPYIFFLHSASNFHSQSKLLFSHHWFFPQCCLLLRSCSRMSTTSTNHQIHKSSTKCELKNVDISANMNCYLEIVIQATNFLQFLNHGQFSKLEVLYQWLDKYHPPGIEISFSHLKFCENDNCWLKLSPSIKF